MGNSNSRGSNCWEPNSPPHSHVTPSDKIVPAAQNDYNINVQPVEKKPAALICIALYDYETRTDGDLAFQTDDLLEILEKSDTDWWRARNKISGMEGYIPSNYVAPLKSVEAEPWYFGKIPRIDAEKLLLQTVNKDGSFLIRESESALNDYSLSIRFNQEVRHYRVKQTLVNDETVYYVNRRRTFLTLQLLIEHYSGNAEGLVIPLSKPCCKKAIGAPLTSTLSYDTYDNWEISRSSLKFERLLGQGQFGQVHQGLWNGRVPVAIKSLKTGTMSPKDFLAEAQLMKQIQHDKLIRLYAVCTTQEPIYIVTELMKNGSLLDYLRGNKGRHAKLEKLNDYAIQIATGMAYLESQNYIHRDLAARNVLVGQKGAIVKIADFGLARVIIEEEYEARAGAKFPLKWTAPEALNYGKFTIKSDVWSFGILLSELITYGQIPYPGMSNIEVMQQIEMNYRMPMPDKCPLSWYLIMLKTWDYDPMKRPTFDALKSMFEDLLFNDGHNYKETNEIF
ncbi:tyrosine-protein kinase Src42A-like [Daphnia pulicaria]|uniref:tyrosine-protein kinase Src42A-like n=1 Tax=Daphnia pulicaria TaxID=35523 RepID=UPI001EEBC7F0|nr:tyrosine-protein kinase Src42A-like [Daphnia pulicaria]